MAANIDMTNNRANIAFLGSKADIWHSMGQEMKKDQPIQTWAREAGLGWRAVKVPAIVLLEGPQFSHLEPGLRCARAAARSFIVRQDTGGVLGFVSGEVEDKGYQIVQPMDVLEWFDKYIQVDERFQLDVAGSLDGGRRIWATAKFVDSVPVAGEEHAMRVLMSTTYDASGSTTNQCTATRVVCQNTLRIAHGDTRAQIKTRHSTKFDADAVGRELAQLAKGFTQYKAIGDAMAQVDMTGQEISNFFKKVLEIPFTAKKEDVSARRMNQFAELSRAYGTSVREGAEKNTAWAALQAVTRYADHDRSIQKGGLPESIARFSSAQFGTGDQLKGRAMSLLLPQVKDKVPA